MKKRTFDEMISHFNITVSEMQITQKQKMELLGMITAIAMKHNESVKHGHWIDCKGSNGKDYRKCSVCLHTQEITGVLNYCSICGTRMDEVVE